MGRAFVRADLTTRGIAVQGRWAHVRYMGRQHLVVNVGPYKAVPGLASVRLACGRQTAQANVWHDAGLPHLPRCRTCEAHARTPHDERLNS
jgi:hypothetical protein